MTTKTIEVPRELLERTLAEWCTQEGFNDKFQAQCQLRILLNTPAKAEEAVPVAEYWHWHSARMVRGIEQNPGEWVWKGDHEAVVEVLSRNVRRVANERDTAHTLLELATSALQVAQRQRDDLANDIVTKASDAPQDACEAPSKGNPQKVVMPPFMFIPYANEAKYDRTRASGYNEALSLWYAMNPGVEYIQASPKK